MVAMREGTDSYLSRYPSFEKGLPAEEVPVLNHLRRKAIERFAVLGFPSLKDEQWRFTNISPLTRIPFELGEPNGPDLSGGVQPFVPADRPGYHLVFVNGWRSMLFRQGPPLPAGTLVCSLAEALVRHRDLVEPYLARLADYEDHAFTALNTAYFQDGAFVHLPAGVTVEEPIYLTFLTMASGKAFVWHRRCLIVAAPGSAAKIVETHHGPEGVYFTNAVTEMVVGANASLDYHLDQRESKSAFHIATVQVRQDRDSRFTSNAIALGGAIARTDLNVRLEAQGCECTLNGLFLGTGDRLIDNHTRIDHAMPRCASHELYKGILDGRSRGVFNGTIYVHPDAQKTDARQTNKTLLLSDEAVIDAKPELEIYADDVKCTHGASIGQLDEEQLFYLRTRGLGPADARQLLTYAFANDVIRRIRIDPLRAQLEKDLMATSLSAAARPVKEVP